MRMLPTMLVLAGCAPVETLTLPSTGAGGSYLIFISDADGKIISGHGYEAAQLAEPFVTARFSGTTYTVLVYGASLDEMRVLRESDGRLMLAPESAPQERFWSPERPSSWGTLGDEGFVARDLASVEAFLGTVRLSRPPCLRGPVLRRIPGLRELEDRGRELRNVTVAVPLGNHVVFGMSGGDDDDGLERSSPRLYRVNIFSGALDELSGGSEFPLVTTRSGPRGFFDEGQAWILWPTGTSSGAASSYVMRPVSEEGLIGPAVDFTVDPGVTTDRPGHFRVTKVAAGRFEGLRTLVAVTDASALIRFDEAARRWVEVEPPSHRGFESCGATVTRILEVDGQGTGLFGVKDGPIVRFDLAREPGRHRLPSGELIEGQAFCRSVRTVLDDDGLEVLNLKQVSDPLTHTEIAFRRSESNVWNRIDVNTLSAQAITPYLEGFVASGNVDSVLYFDRERRRPELPPRACGDPIAVDNNVHLLMRLNDVTIFVGGRRGAAFLDTPAVITSTVVE